MRCVGLHDGVRTTLNVNDYAITRAAVLLIKTIYLL